jgi:hypothetical protein
LPCYGELVRELHVIVLDPVDTVGTQKLNVKCTIGYERAQKNRRWSEPILALDAHD